MASLNRPSREWRKVFRNLIDVLSSDVEGMDRSLDEARSNNNNNNNKVECISLFAELVIVQTKEANRNWMFLAAMRRLHLQLKQYSDKPINIQLNALCTQLPFCDYGRLSGLAHCWSRVPHSAQAALLHFVHDSGASQQVCARRCHALQNYYYYHYYHYNSGTLGTMALASWYCTESSGNIIKRWLREELSGPRAIKQIIQLANSPTSSIGLCSFALGALFGPFSSVAGKFGGHGVRAGKTTVLFRRITLNIFGRSMSAAAALEDAHRFLNVAHHSTENEIFTAWYEHIQLFHLKKDDLNEKNYLKLHAYMAILAAV
ncbi:hypothetical protein TYRP_008521 [Tyrophagus putrescentiae]|nr:hypothetical protein TYRP_008521 [Tyrophagus putrescentiae]